MLLESILNKLGFQTVLEYQVGDYFCDIFVPEISIGFEYDGPWHGLSKKHDAKRDEWLKQQGIPVIRVNDEILDDKVEDYLIEQIERKVK